MGVAWAWHASGMSPFTSPWRPRPADRECYLVDSDFPRLAKSLYIIFYRGGSRPEVVFKSGCRCDGRVLSMGCDCPRLAFSRTLEIVPIDHFWFAATTVENAWNRRRTLHYCVEQSEFIEKPRPETVLKRQPPIFI